MAKKGPSDPWGGSGRAPARPQHPFGARPPVLGGSAFDGVSGPPPPPGAPPHTATPGARPTSLGGTSLSGTSLGGTGSAGSGSGGTPFGGGVLGGTPSLGGTSGSFTTTSAPIWILSGTFVSALVGLLLAVLGKGLPIFIVGWVLASFVSLGFVFVYLQVDARRQENPFYLQQAIPRILFGSGVALSLIATAVCAAQIALYVGRT